VLRGLAAAAIVASSCSSGEVVFIDGFPESTASSALLAVHRRGTVEVQVLSLPLTDRIRSRPLLSDESSRLELLLYDAPVDVLFSGEGPLLAGSGADPLPDARAIFTLDPFAPEVAWRATDRRSAELDLFTYDDPRVEPCDALDVEVVSLQHQAQVAEILLDREGKLYAVVEEDAGVFRIENGVSTPIVLDPPIAAVTATFHRDELWIVTSSGAVWAGPIEGDRLAPSPRSITAPGSSRWLIPNPFGDGLLALTREAELVDLSSGEVLHQLPIIDTTDEGTLAFLDGAVWFSTLKSQQVGRWDGTSVDELPIPNGDLGGAIGFVPGLGVMVGSYEGGVSLYEEGELVPFLGVGLLDLNTIVPFGDGFLVGSDVGALFRWSGGGGSCMTFGLSVEDLELGLPYEGGAVFAPTSRSDRRSAGGLTPLTFVRR
jgi:hypothetical protein